MAIFDVVKYKIRVILNPNKIVVPSFSTPIDVEGTVYKINYHSYEAYKLFQEDRIMEVLAGKGAASVLIRWDNDYKTIVSTEYLIFRSSEASYCKSIWEEDMGIKFDTRPYHELKPKTSIPNKVKAYMDVNYQHMSKGFQNYSLETAERITNKYRNPTTVVELPVEEERIDVPAIGVDSSRQESVAINDCANYSSNPGYIVRTSGNSSSIGYVTYSDGAYYIDNSD